MKITNVIANAIPYVKYSFNDNNRINSTTSTRSIKILINDIVLVIFLYLFISTLRLSIFLNTNITSS